VPVLPGSNTVSHTGVMARGRAPWAPPLVELSGGMVGHLIAWEKIEGDSSRWAWVSWLQQAGGRHVHKVVQVQAASLRPLEPPDACQDVPRRVLGLDGQFRDMG